MNIKGRLTPSRPFDWASKCCRMKLLKDEKPTIKLQEAAQSAAKTEAAPPSERNYRITLFQLGLIWVGIAFAVLTYFVRKAEYFPIDLKITQALQTINYPVFSKLMSAISWPGFPPQTIIITLLIAGLFYFFGFHWESMMSVIAAVFVMGINTLVKVAIQRLRPDANLVNVVAALDSFSFPSGHVMFYTGFFGFIWFLAYSLLKKSGFRLLILIILGILNLFVGISRIYLGQHWASDVVGAYLLGTLTLAVNIQIYRWGKHRFFTHQPVVPEEESLYENDCA
jgi:membrane-associated phospholipid phosphatase